MKAIHRIAISLVALLPLLTACSGDDLTPDSGGEAGRPVKIALSIAVPAAGEATTAPHTGRAAAQEGENDYAEGEGMHSWFIAMVDAGTGTVERVFTSAGELDNVSHDAVNGGQLIATATGTKIFYTFANVPTSYYENLFQEGQPCPDGVDDIVMDGFGTDWATTGLYMAGRQTVTVTEADDRQTLTLWTLRMVAKLEFEVSNELGEDMVLTGIRVAPVNDGSQYYLFPHDATNGIADLPADGKMGAWVPAQPASTAVTGTVAAHFPTGHTGTLSAGEQATMVAYVNETVIPADDPYQEFMVTVSLRRQDGTAEEQRYALVPDNAEGEWHYIARNDHRVIPITLQDLRLDLIPYDFPPIGVLPASVKEQNGTFTCTFHASGDFHLVPRVTSYASGTALDVTFSDAAWESPAGVPDGLYATAPYWHDAAWNGFTPGYVHGTFAATAPAATASRHRLNVTVTPTDGAAPRRLTCPVVISYKP